MKIGLYFGSFNPIHIGHLIIASFVINHTQLTEVWFVVSPQNPLKKSNNLLNEYNRLHLVKLAVEDNPLLKVSDVEFKLPKPSYTIDTLTYLKEKYPQHEFSLIMGSDSYENIEKWKNHQIILDEYTLYVYQRPGYIAKNIKGEKIFFLQAPLLDISATTVRRLIQEDKSIHYLVTEIVRAEIEKCNYYK